MTVRDLMRQVKVSPSLYPAVRAATATGTAVDLRGFDSAALIVSFGAYTDGTHTPYVQHSVDGTTYTDCAASDLSGAFSAVSSSAGASTSQVAGYIGSYRYVRIVMTVSGATTGALSSATVIAGHPRNAPTV